MHALKILIDVALPLNIILYAQRFIACTLDYLCSSRTNLFLLSRMKFPTILVFYMTISIIFVGKWTVQTYEAELLLVITCMAYITPEIVIMVSHMDRPTFFCSSPDLAESLQSSTTFCKFSGKLKIGF